MSKHNPISGELRRLVKGLLLLELFLYTRMFVVLVYNKVVVEFEVDQLVTKRVVK